MHVNKHIFELNTGSVSANRYSCILRIYFIQSLPKSISVTKTWDVNVNDEFAIVIKGQRENGSGVLYNLTIYQ